MIYALNLADDGRILSATYDQYAPSHQPRVDHLPDGDWYDYRYVDGEYIYDPLPDPEPEEPAPSDAERLDMLEAQMSALMGGVADVQ